jgi:5-methylthioadenosine/S-adenosylhomocysteine deaminase
MSSQRWLLQGATMLGPEQERRVDVLVDDDRIGAISETLDPAAHRVDKIVSGAGKLLVPGLVNAHIHSHDRFDKGRFDALPLEVWMSLYNPPTHPRPWTADEIYLRTLLAGVELLRSATTTVVDDVHHGSALSAESIDPVFRAYRDLGIRATVTAAFADRPFWASIPELGDLLPTELKAPVAGAARPASAEEIFALWSDLASRWTERVRFGLSPSAPQRCTTSFLERTWELSASHQLPVFIHVLETRTQVITGERMYGHGIVEEMRRLGLLTPRSVLVHCVWVDETDIEAIAASGATVIHAPASNLKLGSGVAPIPALLARRIPLALGTDNYNANDGADMLGTIKLAATLHRAAAAYEQWPTASDALAMATVGGARAAGLEAQIGRLEVGYKADFSLFNLRALSMLPATNLLNQFIYDGDRRTLTDVVVDGRQIVADGRITTVDEEALLAEVVERSPAIAAKIAASMATGAALKPYLEKAYRRCANAWRP